MDPTPSSSRSSSSSSSMGLTKARRSESISSVPDTPKSSASKGSSTSRRYPSVSCSGLSKPFRSPLKRSQPQHIMGSNAPEQAQSESSSKQTHTDTQTPASASSASVRKQRQALEGRLLLLQQANKCLRDRALSTLPQEIARWREAGQSAAQDLWKLTGAEAGDWSATGGIPSRGDYGLESPPSSFNEAANPGKRKATESPEPSSPPWLLRRPRFTSPGAEEEAAALRSAEDPVQKLKDQDSQGADSQASLPELSELIRRSQSAVGASSTPRQRGSLLVTSDEGLPTSPATASSQHKWNVGRMLDMLGADKSTLEWDAEDEDFRDPSSAPTAVTQTHRRTD